MGTQNESLDEERIAPIFWFLPGALVGVVDGWLSLRTTPSLAGGALDRALVLGLGGLTDGLLAVLLAWCAALPSAWLAGRLWASRETWRARFVIFGLVAGLGLVAAEDAEAHATLPIGLKLAAAVVFGSALGLALALAAPLRRMARAPGVGALCLALLVGLGASLGWSRPTQAIQEGTRNVVLISLDTLRADHLSTYGYERDTDPNLRALAARGTVFEQAQSPSNWTLPSHASMLTGLDPGTLGVLDPSDALSARFTTLAENLASAGFYTGAFVGNGPYSYIGGERGFRQGFSEYHHAHHPHRWFRAVLPRMLSKAWWKLVRHNTLTAVAQIDAVLDWLDWTQDQRFFLFVHLYDIHSDSHRLPYEAPPEFVQRFDPDYAGDFTGCVGSSCASELLAAYLTGEVEGTMSEADLERTLALYDAGIAFTDEQIGRLFARLEQLGLDEETAIVVTSDHGESFFEHGRPLHSDLHHTNLHVPLIVAAPGGREGHRVTSLTEVRDVAPTLHELAGVELNDELRRRSLAGQVLRDAEAAGEAAFSISKSYVALREGDWKMILAWDGLAGEFPEAGERKLYNLGEDPIEQRNLFGEHDPDQVEALRARLEAQAADTVAMRRALLGGGAASIDIPAEELETLKALGYIDE